MRIDPGALGYAALLETALTMLAVFGGPHGYLGVVPWLLQMPGALLFFFGPPALNKVALLVLAFLIQVALWYAVIATWRAVRRKRKAPGAS